MIVIGLLLLSVVLIHWGGCLYVNKPSLIQVDLGGREVSAGGESHDGLPASRPTDPQTPIEIIDEVIYAITGNPSATGPAAGEP